MKQSLIIIALVIVSVLVISGCAEKLPAATAEEQKELSQEALQTKELIEKLSKEKGLTGEGENKTAAASSAETTKELLEKLSKQAGLINDTEGASAGETATTEETAKQGDYEILIEIFTPDPADLIIGVNSTVTWQNDHPTFIHLIGIRKQKPEGTFEQPITQKNRIHGNQTFSFTFTEPGTYEWYSSTKYPTTSGMITVQ